MRYKSKLRPGQILDGRYAIAGIIGSGGSSHVHLGEDLRLPGKRWAVKECVTENQDYGNVQAEAELLISLDHRRLPRVVDFFPPDEDGYSYLVMDYIEGLTLSRYMDSVGGKIPGETLLLFAKQLLEVLQYLHGHRPPIVYRDLKPSNIMLAPEKGLMLIDFGIARRHRGGAEEDTVKLGTVGFAAPEQYGSGESDHRSDLYGLGALLLYLATGGKYSVWAAGMERRLEGRLPDMLVPVLRRLLRPRPDDRYGSAEEVLRILEGVKEGSSAGIRQQEFARTALPAQGKAQTVTLMGTASGIGTTHTSLAAARLLGRFGPVAWVDYAPESPVYGRIRSLAEASGRPIPSEETEGPLDVNGIHCWKRPEDGTLEELAARYRYIVLDIGSGEYEGAGAEFARGDIPLLLASGADWRMEETLQWLRRSGWGPGSGWKIGLPLAGVHAADLLRRTLGVREVYALPFQPDPLAVGGNLESELRSMLAGILEKGSRRKKGRFFQRK
ncbi:serine/threonine protein kinase [Paenibacillus sophorae]|uniref:non-specific serine/threonine protein kinase n=1 Tax=Paenibacillus sophorae TaxID=1333845 RepID=A0A1H8FZ72_9BACL|nr:serine/threonine-protein kinase [Paenibacillus sophorae]QWU14026.1 serine/threonine protein kinase [Paenibacillus sophorae]SEN36815.1 serine/threonine protein kinase [Paenibacillus sophorae]